MSKRILVVGDAMLDVTKRGTARRLSPEAPVPVLSHELTDYRAGGAANVAKNVRAMGGAVKFISCSGVERDAGQLLREKCMGLDTTWIHSAFTTQRTRFFADNHMLLRVDVDALCSSGESDLIYEAVCEELPHASLLVLSDYAKGALAKTALMIRAAHEHNVRVLVDPKGADWMRYQHADWIKANEAEVNAAMAYHDEPHMRDLQQDLSVGALIVTRGAQYPLLVTDRTTRSAPFILPKRVVDVTGGGDSYVAAMAVCLAAGSTLDHALEFAARAGAVAVSQPGTYVVTKEDVSNVAAV